MRAHSFCAFILCVVSTVPLAARQAATDDPGQFHFAALTDPACPVVGYQDPVPSPKELHVLYFPMGKDASIKDPKSLVLHLVFDNGFNKDDNLTLPFTRRADGVWLATVPLRGTFHHYAIYRIENRQSQQVDANDGKDFEVPFCDVEGHRDEQSVRFEAESYTGKLEAYGVDRPTDYAKAIEVLEEHIHPPSRGQSLISSLWKYKLKLHGDTPEARSTLLAEIKIFIGNHSSDGFGLLDALNFVAYQDWVPPETMEILVKAIESKYPDDNARAFLLLARGSREKDKAKQIALMWELVDKYPESPHADLARKRLLLEVTDISQQEKLYRQLRTKDPEDPFAPWNMASTYAKANQKLPEALALLDEAAKLFDASVQNKRARIHYPEATLKDVKLRIALQRADILLRLSRPGEAVSTLQPLKNDFTSGHSYYLLAKALEDAGDKAAAIDAYVEAVVRPSNDEEKANSALESLWLAQKLGSKQALQNRIERRLMQNFSSADYLPQVLEKPAPDFDLTTLHGERLRSSQLRGKKVVLDFWSVWCGWCLPELKPLQDFQEKHPELVVATVVDASTDVKKIEAVRRTRKLTSLRISRTSSDLPEKFNAVGVPNTLIIDEDGYVRIWHSGSIPDVSRYLEADLKAIAAAGPATKAIHAAAK
jgi:thiol-disulfide isomerase/thioredoxin